MARFRFHSRRTLALCVWSCCGDRDGNTQTNINVTDRPHRPRLWNFYFTHHLEISHKCSAECISSYWGYLHMNVHYIYSIFLLLNQTAPLFPQSCRKVTQSFLSLVFINSSSVLSGVDLIQQIGGIIAFFLDSPHQCISGAERT